jgi:hypothetical protein
MGRHSLRVGCQALKTVVLHAKVGQFRHLNLVPKVIMFASLCPPSLLPLEHEKTENKVTLCLQ